MTDKFQNTKVLKAAFTSSISEVIYTHLDVIKTHQQNNVKFKSG